MAEVLGCSLDAVQSIESGRLQLSGEMGQRIEFNTRVSLDWLMADDVSQPILDAWRKPYTRKTFEERQAKLLHGADDVDSRKRAQGDFTLFVSLMAQIMTRAYSRGKLPLYAYRIKTALKDVAFKLSGNEPFDGLLADALGSKPSATRPDLSLILQRWEKFFTRPSMKQSRPRQSRV